MDQLLDNHIEQSNAQLFPQKKAYPSIGQAFGLVGILVLITIVVALPAELIRKNYDKSLNSIINGVTYVITMGALLAFAIKMRRSARFSCKKVAPQVYILSLPMVVSFAVLMEPLVNAIPMPTEIKNLFNQFLTNDIYTFLTVAIAAPLLEEIIFRGIILNGFLKRYSPTKAIIMSAVMFGIFHLNPWQFIPAFLLGLVIGWLYWKTNSIIPGIVIHFINNSLTFLMMVLTGDSLITIQQLMSGGRLYYIFYGMCIPIFLGSLFLIRQRLTIKEA